MRPLKLMLEGFRSHHERTEITFEGRTLVAVVGPTGAGKSSVLDGISYALYGRTPREQRSVRKLICSNSEEARVNFRFEVDRRVFEITRVMRRKSGPSPHLLVEVDSGEQTSGEAAVSRRVEELLGLDFGAFCASVLLAQGEFARFLQAAPTKRAQILKGVFRLEQIDALREAAQVRVDALTGDLRVIEGERRGIPVDLDELLADAKRRHKELRTRAEDLAAALPREQAFERRRARAQDELDRAVEALGDVEAAEADLLPPDKLADLAGQESSIAALVGEAERVLATSERERAAALEALSALERELGREADLYDVRAQAGALAGLIERVDALTADRKALDEDIGGLRDLLATEERAHAEGVALLDEARRARAGVERGHAAHVLRSNLRRGDPCPVCERVVSKVPAGHAPPELSEVEASEKVALARESEAASAVVRARTSLEVAMERGRALAGQEATAREELDERRATIEQRLGGVEDPLAEINGRLERLADARERVDLAQREREGAREKLERNRGLKEDFAKIRRRVAGSLISVAGRIGVDAPDVDAPADVLADHAREARRALTRRAERLRAERDAAERDANEVTGRLVELHRALSLGDGESIAAAMSEARSAADLANAQRRDYDAKRKLAKELDEREAGLVARRALYDQLYRDCAPKGFVTFLLEERARLLLELASERLHAMTDRYRLELGAKEDLNVIDELDGEKRRPVDTLSGGETFLASLALALALADLVTREGGRLQCFFLDEGFGTLDADSFDVAMEGIERIVGEDRLIGLVSHVPGLRERVPDRIELSRGPDGMTRVLAGGALG